MAGKVIPERLRTNREISQFLGQVDRFQKGNGTLPSRNIRKMEKALTGDGIPGPLQQSVKAALGDIQCEPDGLLH